MAGAKPWPVQMGSMALLPEQLFSLQASLGHHMPPGYAGSGYLTAPPGHRISPGYVPVHGGVAASGYLTAPYYPTGYSTAHGYMGLHNNTHRVVGAHPHEGWRGAQHVIQRARYLPQPHVGPGGPHTLLNEISQQALHRYRACHARTDTVDPAEIEARCAATLASAQRLTAALLALCGETDATNASRVAIAASLEQLHEQLRVELKGSDSAVGTIEQLRAQLDLLHVQMTERQATSTNGGSPDSSCSVSS